MCERESKTHFSSRLCPVQSGRRAAKGNSCERNWHMSTSHTYLNSLLLLALGQLGRISYLEEVRGHLSEPERTSVSEQDVDGRDLPFWLNGCDLSAVLFRGEHQFVVYKPFGLSVEQGRRRMDENGCAFDQRFVALRRESKTVERLDGNSIPPEDPSLQHV